MLLVTAHVSGALLGFICELTAIKEVPPIHVPKTPTVMAWVGMPVALGLLRRVSYCLLTTAYPRAANVDPVCLFTHDLRYD